MTDGNKIKQESGSTDDPKDITEMGEYYKGSYAEVYLIRDLKLKCVIGVMGYPAKNSAPAIELNGRKLNFFGYKNRLLSCRQRYDRTPTGEAMIGFESLVGDEYHDTRIAKIEEGIVAKVVMSSGVTKYDNIGGHSPYEIAKQKKDVEYIQSSQGVVADYGLETNEDGNRVERFETFALERIK